MSVTLAGEAARLLVDPVLALVFPARCPVCSAPVDRPTRGPLCLACWARLPRHVTTCPCGRPGAGATCCSRCRRGRSPFRRGASLGPYEGALRVLVHELKYRGRRRAAAGLADRLLHEAGTAAVLDGADGLVPVPLHPRRLRQRGFNQSEELARALAAPSGLPLLSGVLVRRSDTPPQAGLTAAARRTNVAGAFAVRRRPRVAGSTLVLVDDVYTTGATARECARVLHEAGAKDVRVLTVARAL